MNDDTERDSRMCEVLDVSLDALTTERSFQPTLPPDMLDEWRGLMHVIAELETAVRCWKLLPPPPERFPAGGEHARDHYDTRHVKLVGRYQVLGELGEGGMGTVYKARDPKLDRLVALKVPHFPGPKHARDVARQRFEREARAVAQLRHPHICPIHDVGEDEGRPFAVLTFVEGGSLADVLKNGPLAPDRAAGLIRKVALGLDAAHQKGIVHRDIKPGNILLDADGEPLLSDFGLARMEFDAERLTADGSILGTPAYMAPEQAAGDLDKVGPLSDVYSLGVVLYQSLTGRLPFKGTLEQLLTAIQTGTPPAPTSLRPDLDPALEAIVLKAMAKRPEDRYTSARAFADALASGPGPARVDLPTTVAEAKPSTRPAGTRRVAAGLLALGLLLVALVLVFRRDTAPPNPDGPAQPPPRPTWVFQDQKAVLSAVADHLRATPETQRGGRRFLTLTHLANRAGDDRAESVHNARAALKILFTSVLAAAEPRPIDPAETIYAIDLQALGWESDGRWKAVQAAYPYGLKFDGSPSPELRKLAAEVVGMTGDDLPVLRADWFVVAASQAPLYPTLTGQPGPRPSSQPLAARDRYQADLSAADVAAELGLESPEPLLAKLRADAKLRGDGLAPLLEGKPIPRYDWSAIRGATSLFQKAARALAIGESFNQH